MPRKYSRLTLLVVLSGWSILAKAQGVSIPDDPRQAQKAAKNQQKAIEKYNKAQQKAQRKADKKQQKAIEKYNKAQQKAQEKAYKQSNQRDKHTV
jgi:hypothetical protein